jgi:hypothetical protein
MIYFSTKRDLAFMKEFLEVFNLLRRIEEETRARLREEGRSWLSPMQMFESIRREASMSNPEYADIRTRLARMLPRAIGLAEAEGIPHIMNIQAAPLEGSTRFSGSVFQAVLDPPSDLVDFDSVFRDTSNQIIGNLERKERAELLKLINPVYWLKELIIFLIRLPYSTFAASGFDVERIQDHFIARAMHLLYVVLLLYILLRFGLLPITETGLELIKLLLL